MKKKVTIMVDNGEEMVINITPESGFLWDFFCTYEYLGNEGKSAILIPCGNYSSPIEVDNQNPIPINEHEYKCVINNIEELIKEGNGTIPIEKLELYKIYAVLAANYETYHLGN